MLDKPPKKEKTLSPKPNARRGDISGCLVVVQASQEADLSLRRRSLHFKKPNARERHGPLEGAHSTLQASSTGLWSTIL